MLCVLWLAPGSTGVPQMLLMSVMPRYFASLRTRRFASLPPIELATVLRSGLYSLNTILELKVVSQISQFPHAFNSHENDEVRRYIADRLAPIADDCTYIEFAEDLVSNGTWYSPSRGAMYFEGTNILVKVEGVFASDDPSDIDGGGVLFSAHLDSVSTAPGATDDAIGIVTMMQMVEYFSKPEHRPRRTAVFLFNNAEEDGLNGAHAFFEHPWAKLTTAFFNLEGAGSGGCVLCSSCHRGCAVLGSGCSCFLCLADGQSCSEPRPWMLRAASPRISLSTRTGTLSAQTGSRAVSSAARRTTRFSRRALKVTHCPCSRHRYSHSNACRSSPRAAGHRLLVLHESGILPHQVR